MELPLFVKSGTKNFYASYATPQAPQSSVFEITLGRGNGALMRVKPYARRLLPAQRRVREPGRRQREDASASV